MSRAIWFEVLRKRVLKRAKQIHVTPKLSLEVEAELRELYQTEKEA